MQIHTDTQHTSQLLISHCSTALRFSFICTPTAIMPMTLIGANFLFEWQYTWSGNDPPVIHCALTETDRDSEAEPKCRAVFQGSNVRTKTGRSPHDICGEISSAPSSLTAARVTLAASILKGFDVPWLISVLWLRCFLFDYHFF